jgi:tetratricopeptide (TPR) repeat protein
MFRTALSAILALALALPAFGQIVKVTRTDGTTVQGDLLGYENGRYRLRLPNGTVEDIEELRVQDVVLISPTGDRPLGRDTGVLEAARSAFERNELDLAMQKVAEALRSLDADRSQMSELAARVSSAYIERLLEQHDVARFSEGLRQVVPTLTPSARKDLFQKMAERLVDLDRSAPDSAFTAALGDAVARLADEGAIPEESRAALADLLVARAQKEIEKKDYGAALTLLKGAARVDSKRRDSLKGRLAETALAQARALIEKRDPAGAAAAAKEAAAFDPDNAEVKAVLDAVEFAALRQRVDTEVGGPVLVQALRKFLERELKPEEREWAEQALQRAASTAKPQSAQLATYFPVRLGRTLLYRRGDGTTTERLHTDSITRDGDLTRVYNTVQENYREYAETKAYLVEIERDAVYLPTTGEEREPLLKFPAQPGDSWSWQSRGRQFKRTVKSLGESVTVGREGATRVFQDCLVVEFASTLDRDGVPVVLTSRSTYAPGVGLVKLEYLDAQFRKFNLDLLEETQE